MKNDEPISGKNQVKEDGNSLLEDIIREVARRLLRAAIEQEVSAYIDMFKDVKAEDGRRMVVRHGFLPERSLLTGMGPIAVKQPRVRDKRTGDHFTSAILPAICSRPVPR